MAHALLAEALNDAHAGAGVGSTTEGPVDLRRHYANDYYGPPTVTTDGTSLSMSMGPPSTPETFALGSFDGDTFTFQTIGENVTGKSGAAFTVGADGTATLGDPGRLRQHRARNVHHGLSFPFEGVIEYRPDVRRVASCTAGSAARPNVAARRSARRRVSVCA